MKRVIPGAAMVLLLAPLSSIASVINSNLLDLGGGAWRYEYVLTNDTLAAPFDEFTIYFDRALFANLRDASGPAGWDLLTVQPDPALPDDGFLDGLDLLAPLGPGESLGTFALTVDFLGTGAPGSQSFDFLDSSSFTVLDSGSAVLSRRASVPEPDTMPLAVLGILGVTAAARRGRFPRRESACPEGLGAAT